MEVGVRGQAPPSLMDSLYRNTEEVTAMSSATLSNGQFIQKHRGGNSNVADVTRIHYAPSPKALNFTVRLLLRCIISLRAFINGA